MTFIKFCSDTLNNSTGTEIAQIPQGSEAWKQQRLSRVTARIVRTVVHFRHYQKPQSSLVKTVTGVTSFDSKQLCHGRKYEKIARKLFMEKWSLQHANAQCQETGLHIDSDNPHLLASPDGFLQCDFHGASLLEVKCAFKHWQSTMDGILDDYKYHFDSSGGLKQDSSWHWQVQTQLGVTKIHRAYLALLYGDGKKLHTVEIIFCDSVWQQVVQKSKDVFPNVSYHCCEWLVWLGGDLKSNSS